MLVALLVALGSGVACAAEAGMPLLQLHALERLQGEGDAPPPLSARGPASDGVLDEGATQADRQRWLRARATLDAAPRDAVALYISTARRARVFVNGVQVGNASVTHAERFGWNHPIFYSVPATLLHAGENVIDVRVQLNRFGRTQVLGLRLGPHDLLQREYDRVFFWRVSGPQLTSVVMLMMGFPALLVWLLRHDEAAYGWFGAACVLAALRNGHLFITAPEFSRWYDAWAAVPLHWMLVSLMMFSLRLCRQHRPRLERSLMLATAAWTVLLLAEPVQMIFSLGYAWLTALWIGTIGYVALQYRRTPRLDLLLLLLALTVAQVLGGLDLLLQLGLRGGDARIYLMPYSMLFFGFVMGAHLVDAFVRARTQQERLNQALDARLAEREREIAEEHAKVLLLQREQAAAAERERIMRELHDGLGSSLISSIQAVETGALQSGQLAGVLRDCVDDLRLALDSLRPTGAELLPVLGNFRYRMEGRLAQAGVRLDWRVGADTVSPTLAADRVLHTLRIVQEAFANALKHASPRCIRLEFECVRPDYWRLCVSDDGPGFDPAAPAPGHGQRNMRFRAARIPAQLHIGRRDGWTVVELVAAPEIATPGIVSP